ncbi:MAG TPA: hypothetical protein PLE74_01985 [Candidatus Cloacimonadota bacterium]|nr:hypothetical protein [Candidatus Cloacimonadota bacterium]HPT71036.1 hypothetical protein [Candidatus Cloacimonadota bacterium]
MPQQQSNIEAMTPEEKFNAIANLKSKIEDHFLALGEIFSQIKRSQAYKIKGFPTFKEFIETDLKLTNSMAMKLIGIYELYIEELDVDENDVKNIGVDRLAMIKPIIQKATFQEQENWLEQAKSLPTQELKDKVKELRQKEKKLDKTMKDVLAEQYVEKMTTFFNCSVKELNFKLALFFQDQDLEQIRVIIKEKQRRFEEESQLQGGMQ